MAPIRISDASQDAFVQAPIDNHIRLLAPAGCGKTQSILARCAHLASTARPKKPRMLLITFTRAARDELASRVSEDPQFAHVRDQLDISTLNGWGFRRVKTAMQYPKLLTSKDDFHFAVKNSLQGIWSRHEAVRRAIESKGKGTNKVPREIMGLIDTFKTLGFDHTRDTDHDRFSARLATIRAQGLTARVNDAWDTLQRINVVPRTQATTDETVFSAFYGFWLEAVAHQIASAAITLEDQKYVAYLDERKKADTGGHLQGAAGYEHVLVDEFQDINPLDLALVKAIVERNCAKLTIVGDDDQAIFEWRGATPEFILHPERHFGFPFRTFTLEMNYRSPRNIVEHAQRLIAHNVKREPKATRALSTDAAEIVKHRVDSLERGIEFAIAEVERCIAQGTSPNRVALIGRKRAQLIPYQVVFASRGIPFCAAEDLQVFMSTAFERLLELLVIRTRGGKQARSQVVEDAMKLCALVPKWPPRKADKDELKHVVAGSSGSLPEVAHALRTYKGSLKGTQEMAEAVTDFLAARSVSDVLRVLSESFEGLQADLGKAEDEIWFSDPPFYYLTEYAERYREDFDTFVTDIERARSQLVHVPPFDDPKFAPMTPLWERPVHLMTALRSKGKEFDSVVLLDVNDGIWPSKLAHTPDEREAERRVFYVAFTRARRRVTFLTATRLGGAGAVVSPYLSEMGL